MRTDLSKFFLRNNLKLSPDCYEVSQEWLLSLVVDRLIDSNTKFNCPLFGTVDDVEAANAIGSKSYNASQGDQNPEDDSVDFAAALTTAALGVPSPCLLKTRSFDYGGELYLLATDQGYLNQPDLVWEKLNEVRRSNYRPSFAAASASPRHEGKSSKDSKCRIIWFI
ncbi:unnamed protein product [Eruca vesicaria subsp. sativa]|uniref:MINDY deubiquitinase domain-containing protein n=1 Tax=Eruca vesicaria subsp. sativa TaxID=29727 RepID=A0ABC8JTP8_ERUVS|nr:unnamed protein product [Eruca vesicaria subsp. sativa]